MPKLADHQARRRQITHALLRIASTRGLRAVSMRKVAGEAGVSLRVVQYYFADKQALLDSGLAELAARLDRRIRAKAAGDGTGLAIRQVICLVLGAIVPTDETGRADALAAAAFYAAALTDPALAAAGRAHPDALEDYLTTRLVAAQQTREVDAKTDPRTTVAALLALANGLTASVLGGQRTSQAAQAILHHSIDTLIEDTSTLETP